MRPGGGPAIIYTGTACPGDGGGWDAGDSTRAGFVAGAVIGAVMKAMKGQADAARVRELILERAAQ